MNLTGKTILITGAARRLGAAIALHLAEAGADIIIHHGHSSDDANHIAKKIIDLGQKAWIYQCDLADLDKARGLIDSIFQKTKFDALVNNAAIFEPLDWQQTTLTDWQQTLNINLTAPFILSQQFALALDGAPGRIINMLDWRALHPGADHLAYTISKAGLAALTKSLAQALAPTITVNGLALGAILPPSDGANNEKVIEKVPLKRWANLSEVGHAVSFLLSGPAYITGEIIHIDGGRHLT